MKRLRTIAENPPPKQAVSALTANGADASSVNGAAMANGSSTLLTTPALADLEFPGCDKIHLPRDDLDTFERHFEFWDGETETAWMVREPVTSIHENPSQALAALMVWIGAVRGSPIRCYGNMDLVLLDESGERHRILQADQCVYLRPERARMLDAMVLEVGRNEFPDVVLEVDHTTNVKRGKLAIYQAWGFPEIWVEVPDRKPRSRRPGGLQPGLTIHLRVGSEYRVAQRSRAFPGWRATDIHDAMNETTFSPASDAIVERIGERMGARDGTGPDDAPLLRSQRSAARSEGRVEGERIGRAEGEAVGREAGLYEAVQSMARSFVLSRGITVSAGFPGNVPGFATYRSDAIAAAALRCRDEQDFARQLRIAAAR